MASVAASTNGGGRGATHLFKGTAMVGAGEGEVDYAGGLGWGRK